MLMIAGVHIVGLACVALLILPALRGGPGPSSQPRPPDGSDEGRGMTAAARHARILRGVHRAGFRCQTRVRRASGCVSRGGWPICSRAASGDPSGSRRRRTAARPERD